VVPAEVIAAVRIALRVVEAVTLLLVEAVEAAVTTKSEMLTM